LAHFYTRQIFQLWYT